MDLKFTQDTRVCCGGGSTEMAMSRAVMEAAAKVGGKESIAVESFAKAVQQIPMIISENAGFDAQEMLGSLKKAHADGRRGEVGVECSARVVVQRSSHGFAGIDASCTAWRT